MACSFVDSRSAPWTTAPGSPAPGSQPTAPPPGWRSNFIGQKIENMTVAYAESIARELQNHIKTVIGITTRVNVMEFDTIPRTLTGKARRVIDQRPKQL